MMDRMLPVVRGAAADRWNGTETSAYIYRPWLRASPKPFPAALKFFGPAYIGNK
jgi:hypothetical protein